MSFEFVPLSVYFNRVSLRFSAARSSRNRGKSLKEIKRDRQRREREREETKGKERRRKKKGKRSKTRERKIEEREARTGRSGTMADSLIDVGLGNGGEEIACLKVAERAWQENFPDKGEEKRAGAKSPGTKSLTFSPADRSYPPEVLEKLVSTPSLSPPRVPFRPRRNLGEIQP